MKIEFTLDDIKDIDDCTELYDAFSDIIKENAQSFDNAIFKKCNDIIYNYTKIYRNVFFERNLSNDELRKIKECIVVARMFYKESIDEINLLKTIIALCLVCFYEQNFSLFSDLPVSDNFIDKLHTILKNISLSFMVEKDARYSESKRIAVYNEAKKKSDFSKILQMMDELGHSPYILERIEHTWGILFQWIWFIDRDFIFEFLETANPETIEVIFWKLKDQVFDILTSYHNKKNYYLLLRGFMFLFHLYDEKLQKQTVLTVQKLPDCTDWLIHILHDDNLKLVDYINSMRLVHLKSFNYFLGKAIAKDISLLDIYLLIADMDYRPSQIFSDSFLADARNEQNILQVGQKITESYFNTQINFHDKVNKDIGYLNLIVVYFSKKYSTKKKYLAKLCEVCSKIIEIQNGWEFEEITKNWILLFYLAMANNILKFYFTEEELKTCLPILFDKREEILYKKKNIETIKLLLTSELETITLTNQNSDVMVSFKRNGAR